MNVSVKEALIMEQGGELYFSLNKKNVTSPRNAGINKNNLYLVPTDSEVNTPIE